MAWGIASEISSTGPIGSSKRTSTQQDIPQYSSASTASTLVAPQERTTLTGRPITRSKHDKLSGMMFAEGGGFGGSNIAGANLAPPGYTNDSLVHIPIKISDIGSPLPASEAGDDPAIQSSEKKHHAGLMSKLKHIVQGTSSKHEDVMVVEMTRGDYLKYWAKGEDGKFLPNVVEPGEGRSEWVRLRKEAMEERKKHAPAGRKGASDGNFGMASAALGGVIISGVN